MNTEFDIQELNLDTEFGDKKLRKQYLKDIKKHRKELVKIAKNTGPWEYGASFEFIVEHLKMMVDYYKLGYNVWGIESDDPEFERCKIALDMITEYESYEYLPDEERKAIAEHLGFEFEKISNNTEFVETDKEPPFGEGRIYTIGYKYYSHEEDFEYSRMVNEAEEQHFRNFIKLLQEKFRYLWD